MSRLKLYHVPGSCAQAVRIALEEAGADYTLLCLDFDREEQRSAEYLAINPKGRVPALITEHGVLTEVPALLAYIAQRFPEAGLAPGDAFAHARMQEFNCYLASTVHVAYAHGRRAARWADSPVAIADMQRKVEANMLECCKYIEQHYLRTPWVMGDAYSVADGYLYTIFGWLQRDGMEVARFSKLHEHRRCMEQRAAVRRALMSSFPMDPDSGD